jgi:hypothetical protein
MTDNQLILVAYPNPANNVITIKVNGIEQVDANVEIMDMLGRVMPNRIQHLTQFETNINIDRYPSGNYLLHFRNQNGETSVLKFEKQ